MKSVKSCLRFLVLSVVLVLLPYLGEAQAIFSNPINDGNPSATNPHTTGQTVVANITASGVGRGSGLTANAGSGRYNAASWPNVFTATDYFTFTITPNSGYSINFISLVYTGQASGTGPTTYAVRSSRDNFVSNIASPGVSGNISLSAATFQGITSAIEFRVYGWGGNNAAGTYSINDFTFNGTVVSSAGPPTLAAPSATNVLDTTAKYNSNVLTSAGSSITEKGFVWSTSTNPVIGGGGVTKVIVSGNTLGAYDATLNNLPRGTRIFFKAYAINTSGTGYSTEASFYTLSVQPVHSSSFTATATSKNSIELNWSMVNNANGYLIIQRIYNPPTGVPVDANSYTVNQALGDGTVIALISSGGTTSTTINGLLQGTRYHYTLFPFGYNGVNVQTYNYQTSATISAATDSTWGRPTSLASTIETASGEAVSISSINNTAVTNITNGTRIWTMNLTDGGPSMNDGDDLPTIINSLRLRKGASNTVADWLTSIESVGLFDDSTGALLSTGVVTSTTITFSGFTAKAADDNYRPLSVRITLEKRAHIDNSIFQFLVAETDIVTEGFITSSQKTTFSRTTDATKNKIEVVATKLRFVNQPVAVIEAGVAFGSAIQVEALDTFDAKDLDFASGISIEASSSNLIASPRTVSAVTGVAGFDTLRFNLSSVSDTLVARSGSLYPARSTPFQVIHSAKSDIVADIAFTYPTDIIHTNFNDPNTITNTNGLEVFRMFLRDGGVITDNDFVGTVLDSLVLGVQSPYLIERAALYQGNTKLAETDTLVRIGTADMLLFGGINLVAMDGDSASLSLYVTFKDSAVDGHRLAFIVNAAFAKQDLSKFEYAHAGLATSATDGNKNRVDIVAQKLVFSQQPSDVARGSAIKPAVEVIAIDSKGNRDLKNRNINVFVTRSGFTPSSIKSNATDASGEATFARLQFNIVSDNVYLRALSAGLDSAVSDSFSVLIPQWYRSVKTGNWSDTAVWEFSVDYGATWQPAVLAPDYNLHGMITVRTNDTVQMDGSNQEKNTLDETIIEAGGVLVTPMLANTRLMINDSDSLDMVIKGKLIHKNGLSVGGVTMASGAQVFVVKDAAVELAGFGDALDWAGNASIHFDSGSYYIHNTDKPGTISNGVMFPNASATTIPTFLVTANAGYPDPLIGPGAALSINGMLEIAGANTFTISERGELHIRDGLTGSGKLHAEEFAQVKIVGNQAIIGDSGEISLAGDAGLEIVSGSTTRLLANKPFNGTAWTRLKVAGVLDMADYGFAGTQNVLSENGATIITAHAQGLSGSFGTTGNFYLHEGTNYIFNGTVPQQTGTVYIETARTIRVNNSNGLTLSNRIRITDTLYLGFGHVYSDSASILSLAKNGVIHNYSATSFVDGPLKRMMSGNVPVLFPIGNNGNFGPVNYTSAFNGDEWVTLEYVAGNPDNNGYSIGSRGKGLAQINTGEYWKLNASIGNVQVLYTNRTSITSSPLENRRIAAWDGSQWQSQGPVNRNATATETGSDAMQWVSIFTLAVDSACVPPAPPAFVSVGSCSGEVVNLEANGSGTVRWFVNNTDIEPFATGEKVVVGLLAYDTTFYADVKSLGCVSQRVPYSVVVNEVPQTPVVSGSRIVCYNAPADLSGLTLGTMIWYSDKNGIQPLHTGSTLQTAGLTNDTTIYAAQVVNGCRSLLTPVFIGVNPPVPAPSVNPIEACQGFHAEMEIISSNTLRWYADASTGSLLYQGSRFRLDTVRKDTVFYVEAIDGKNCPSERVRAEVIAVSLPAAPVTSANELCEGNAVQISTTSTASKVFWYDNASAQLPLDSGVNFTTPTLFADKVFYASSYDGRCYSAKTAFDVQVNPYPQSFSILTPSSIPGTQVVSIQSDAIAENYDWNFGENATPQTAVGPGPHNVSWSKRGVKTISLRVWNGTAGSCSTQVTKLVVIDAGTGLYGNEGDAQVQVYPNPVASGATVTVEPGDVGEVSIQVFDAAGKMVLNRNTQGATTWSTANWKPGLYLVRTTGTGYSTSEKLIIK